MKVLFIGDIHVKHNNVQEIEKLLDVVRRPEILRERYGNIDFVMLAGDVLDAHEKIDSQLMNIAYELVRVLRRLAPVYVLVGNHDYINNQQFLTDNHWMNGMKEWRDVTIVDAPIRYGDFVMVPYVYPGRLKEALSRLESDWRTAVCVFAHQEMRGCKMGAIVSQVGDEWHVDDNPLMISGHIHERQRPQPNVYYPGSVLNHAFGYDSQGMYVFDFDETGLAREHRIDLQFAKKKTIYATISDVMVLPERDAIASNRLNVSGSMVDIIEFKHSRRYADLKAKNVKIVFTVTVQPVAAATTSDDGVNEQKVCLFRSTLDKLVADENDVELEREYVELFNGS